MKDEYKLNGAVAKINLEVEKDVADKLSAMEKFSGISQSELTNTALKRFIVTHKDFLPKDIEAKK